MDKNTVIGFILIFFVVIGFSYLNRPSPEQGARQRHLDSMAIVERQQAAQPMPVAAETPEDNDNLSDSVVENRLVALYGDFATAAQGEETFITLENEYLTLRLSTKGGCVYSAQLKKYTNYEDKPLILFDKDEAYFSATLITANNRIVNTGDLYFETAEQTPLSATFRLKTGDAAYLDFVYKLHPDDYIVDFNIVPHNLHNHVSSQTGALDLTWKQKIRQQEKGRKFEERYTQLFYKYLSDNVENLKETKDDSKAVSNKLKWIGYKDQYFSSALIAKESFGAAQLDSRYFKNGEYLKDYSASTSVDFDIRSNQPVELSYFFGPNDYNLLKSYDKTKFEGQDLQLEKLVYLGWSLFRSINKWIIIPVFDWLIGSIAGVGLAILLLTLIVKTVLFPLVYKSLMSSAKMRVMKPQIEAITAKYPGQENAMKRQQQTMELYRQVGINPMSGCVPMLIQMPILLALFWFFPSAIELRHQSFLWAKDLATYDAIIQWNTYIPFISDSFGNHLSLFCLLMTAVNVIYTKYNMDQANTGQEQMPGMKMMMYIMPVFMMFFLNSYSSGLNYYYFISTLITILQTVAFRYFLNEKDLLAKLEANKKNPSKKKSGFMARLEEAQRKQQAMLREQQKRQGKGGRR
ncbi:MAG: membrane protein insertase YidC [Dysgonamonadaceae bacterium]|jgi:YidC/Oxa1 family membrane protein insertase|nr:membrane protein insertase YidC [Dysgonamonadaceae bacterium]